MTDSLSIDGVIAKIQENKGPAHVSGLTLPVKALLARAIARGLARPMVVVVDKEARAEEFCETLGFFLSSGGGARLLRFPAWETLPYDELSPHPSISGARLEALYALAHGVRNFIMVTSSEALCRKVIPPAAVKKATVMIKKGEEIDLEKLAASLAQTGYRRVELAEEAGEFSIRGGILDIFPGAAPNPLRIELFGDSVESIRRYDPSTQKSVAEEPSAMIPPFREVFYTSHMDPAETFGAHLEATGADEDAMRILELLKSRAFFAGMENYLPFFFDPLPTFFDIMPPEATLVMDEDLDVLAHIKTFYEQAQEERDAKPGWAPPQSLFPAQEEVESRLSSLCSLAMRELAIDEPDTQDARIITSTPQKYRGDLARFFADLNVMIRDGWSVILAATTKGGAQRLRDLLKEREMGARLVGEADHDQLFSSLLDPQAELFEERLYIMEGTLLQGFIIGQGKWAVICEDEIFGKSRKAKRRATPANRVFSANLSDLRPGDMITHKVHGVGRYLGTRPMTIADREGEFLEIEYAENQRLFLPIHGIDLIDRYMGSGGPAPALDRMGGVSWKKTKGRVKKDLMAMAGELLKIQAQREVAKGCAFGPDGQFHREFADTFEFFETEDQLAAIEDVTADMEKDKPMDRLVCGDVGYGKTEVALRAAFKAAYEGKQVALLAPTTLLTRQHYQTFADRFKSFPINIESISRFKSKKEQSAALAKLATGEIDILIGTHRILQKDVVFKNLGLVIVDEEQRFGVRHKERLKTIRTGVDTLILTATPIPRTLHGSLMGIKDLSVIETPPPSRQAIYSSIVRFSGKPIREAILRELDRGGQAFFVHNKVRSIHSMARYLGKLVPEARFLVAHGQMNEHALEDVMTKFLDRSADVLICTTIIESGLDIPSANTILINRADQLGLAQLYQLRGRVGRDKLRAYCYLIIPGGAKLKPAAKKRLKAMEELTGLGGGFKLAARDMEIRGAGNLLGAEQSGHIDAVGFETYRRMVEDGCGS